MLTLGDLHIGQDAIIRVVGGEGELRHHLLDMGLTPGTEVTLRKTAPMGDPIEVELRGYELTLRLADAQKIEIDSVHATDRAAPSEERHKVALASWTKPPATTSAKPAPPLPPVHR